MSGPAITARFTRPRVRLRKPAPGSRPGVLPAWSVPAAMRAARATVVVPGVFALSDKVIGDLQMATFAAFGGFATLVLASFGGSRRDKATAHLGLALAGSALVVIGTLVSSRAWLAAIATVPVAFGAFFAGVAGPNAASGVLAALLGYVLPAASMGTPGQIASRLAGWWLASAAGTAAVLLLSPKTSGGRVSSAAAGLASSLATEVEHALRGELKPGEREAVVAAKQELLSAFSSTPYRPTGLATADQALANVVEVLEWCCGLVSDAVHDPGRLSRAGPDDRELLAAAGGLLRDVAALLTGAGARPDFDGLERSRAASAAHLCELAAAEVRDGKVVSGEVVTMSFYARAVALAARTAAADALIATRRARPETVAAQRRRWYGGREDGAGTGRPLTGLAGALGVAAHQASLRSAWFLNSLRGALALAAAVAVADATGVQHGFWVVLGTLSVLRTTASSTGSTAARALGGTVAGFVIGAPLLLVIGSTQAALWIALPIAVLIASYTPGTAPLAVGQAAFTLVVVILFNVIASVGWTVGLVRIEDVALGCAVSLLVGILFWPRGAGAVVADDLADAFRRGGAYLQQAVDWALGVRQEPANAGMAAVTASFRLDDALRSYLTEQGAKRMPKKDLWSLVLATTRVRLAANSLAGLTTPGVPAPALQDALTGSSRQLAGFYDRVADLMGRPSNSSGHPGGPVEVPPLTGLHLPLQPPAGVAAGRARALWVGEHLRHLGEHASAIPGPASEVAQQRRIRWWRA